MDSFLMICLHSWSFCLEWQERRLDQLRLAIREEGETDQRFVQSLVANL